MPPESDEDEEDDEEELSSVYDFIEACTAGPSRVTPAAAGPSTERMPLLLDDEEEDQYEEEDETAGEVLFTDEEVQRKWLEGRGMHANRGT